LSRATAHGRSARAYAGWLRGCWRERDLVLAGCLRLAPNVGACGEAAPLPQDETTATVVIAAILARHYARGRWPGWYQARIESAAGVVTVTEDDERVRLARLLLDERERPEVTASVLAAVRGKVLVSMLGEQVGPAVALGD